MPFPPDFPKIVVQLPWRDTGPSPRDHPDYAPAKSGDVAAAVRFVDDQITPQKLDALRSMVGADPPTIVAVHAEEQAGRNAIPQVYAAVLGRDLGLPVDTDIVQANRPHRTGSSNLYRSLNPVAFDGPVQRDQGYRLVDAHVSRGGTLADLRFYIEHCGGHVIGATTVTAIPEGDTLAPSAATLRKLRDKLPRIGSYW